MSMLVAGFGFKIAAVPFQMWTPDVYEGAPTPITAFMSVASKAAGFAVVMRIFDIALGNGEIQMVWTNLFVVLSLVTMTVGNLAALLQTNLKRMLAYSSIAHVGYMLMGLAAASPRGLSSVLFYLLVYAFTNIGAFVVIVVMARYVEGEDLSQYAGLAKRAPMLSAILTLCLLSLAGLAAAGRLLQQAVPVLGGGAGGPVHHGGLGRPQLGDLAVLLRPGDPRDVPGRLCLRRQGPGRHPGAGGLAGGGGVRGAAHRDLLQPVHRGGGRAANTSSSSLAEANTEPPHPPGGEGAFCYQTTLALYRSAETLCLRVSLTVFATTRCSA